MRLLSMQFSAEFDDFVGDPIPEMDKPSADRAVVAKAIDADGMAKHAVLLWVLLLHVG